MSGDNERQQAASAVAISVSRVSGPSLWRSGDRMRKREPRVGLVAALVAATIG